MLGRVRDFFNQVRRLFIEDQTQRDPTWQLIVCRVPIQKDYSSCGVCVCVNVWHLTHGYIPSYECISGMKAWRQWVFAFILRGCSVDPTVMMALRQASRNPKP
jgi:hypothetical protein